MLQSGRSVEPITTPWEELTNKEAVESMLYRPAGNFVVSNLYPLHTFGTVGLSTQLPLQPTEVGAVNSAAWTAQRSRNARTMVELDDGTNRGFRMDVNNPGRPLPYLSGGRKIRISDTARFTQPVVIDYRNDVFKLNATEPIDPENSATEPIRIANQPLASVPKPSGAFTVASFNVLNYFTDLGAKEVGCQPDSCTMSAEQPQPNYNLGGRCLSRGAWDGKDLDRQAAKIVTAINELDASVVGLMEIQNSPKLGGQPDAALADLVRRLNAAAGSQKWALVATSPDLAKLKIADQDFITSAIIYQPSKVKLVGEARADIDASGPHGVFANARTPLAARFMPVGGVVTDEFWTVVNHFKSKGSGPSSGENSDQGDGQGAWNPDRVRQARRVAHWTSELTAESGVRAVVMVGDFNSYSAEEPMRELYASGYTQAFVADQAKPYQYSYSFAGLAGSLDHVLVNEAMDNRLTDAHLWAINSVESTALEYSQYLVFGEDYVDITSPRRSSDHDALVAGFTIQGDSGPTP